MPSAHFLSSYTLSCAAGIGIPAVRQSIAKNLSGLHNRGWPDSDIKTWLGQIDDNALEAQAIEPHWDSRNNRIAMLALEQDQFAANAKNLISDLGGSRCGVILGTSTSSIGRTEEAYRSLSKEGHFADEYLQPHIHNPHSTTEFVATYLGAAGPAMTVSTACSSSAKAFASAARWLDQGIVDAVIVGGVDSLCLSVIYGFNSLQLVSTETCKPFDENRGGINLGEAGGFAILTKEADSQAIRLIGYGESTDAWHISTPHPEGLGARMAMEQAIQKSGLRLSDVDYLNLHGTGTMANDETEGFIVNQMFPEGCIFSSTKGWTGHTLGAAGITEGILAAESIATNCIPGNINTTKPGTDLQDRLLLESAHMPVNIAMSNSFGFGGNNCTLIFGGADT
ncbi:MAG: beta-ketoacyl-ACP synthase [Gammaproteobacteria bacterium]|nr:beta-ketoacyl-ACP synthase [Gammaproteobacteria bacterium]